MKPKTQRFILIGAGFLGLSVAAFLILMAFQDSLIFYYLPSDVKLKVISPNQRIRVGGLVENKSVHQIEEAITFRVTDQKESLKVSFNGILPDLFREGQGVVVEGFKAPEGFRAESVLAKHDEKYMPKEIADQLKKEGLWQDAQ